MAFAEKPDLSYDSMTDYPQDCIPNKLMKATGKAKDLGYETIDENVYEPGAHMIAFKVPLTKIRAWIKALSIQIFDRLGNQPDFNVKWYDDPQDWSEKPSGKRSICIDVSKSSVMTPLMYKVTFFITTGILQVQGSQKDHFVDHIFPNAKKLVTEIIDFNKDTADKNEDDNKGEEAMSNVSQTIVKEIVPSQDENKLTNIPTEPKKLDNNNNHEHNKNENNSNEVNESIAPYNKADKFLETMTKIESHFTEAIDKIFDQQNKNLEKIQDIYSQQLKSSNEKFQEVLSRYENATASLTKVEKENTELKTEIKNLKYSSNLEKEVIKSENEVKCTQLKQKYETQLITVNQLNKESDRKTEEITRKKTQIDSLELECADLKKTIKSKEDEILSLKLHNSRDDSEDFQEVTRGHASAQRKTQSDRDRPPHVTLIGTSNLNHIDPNKLSSHYSANKITAYTLQETESSIRNLEYTPNIIVFHSLTNDLKSQSPQSCVGKMEDIIQQTQELYENTKIVISLPTPRSDKKTLNHNAMIASAMLKDKFQDSPDVHMCDNSNLAYKGEPIAKYFDSRDGVHLSQNGVSLLAANIRDSIDRVLDLPRRKTNNRYPPRGSYVRGNRARRPFRGRYAGGRGGGPYY